MYRITTEVELETLLQQASTLQQVVVLKFSAPWCKACRFLAEKMKPMLLEHYNVVGEETTPSSMSSSSVSVDPVEGNVLFADISCINQYHKQLMQKRGATTLPWIQFYAPKEEQEKVRMVIVDSFASGPKHYTWPQLKDKINAFISTYSNDDGKKENNEEEEEVVVASTTASSNAFVEHHTTPGLFTRLKQKLGHAIGQEQQHRHGS